MKVLFDLRPQHLVHLQETRIDPARLVGFLLIAVFAFVSIFNVGYMLLQLADARSELALIKQETATLTENDRRLDENLKVLRDLRERISKLVEFNREELPTVEFMSSLEGAVPPGLKISSIEMRPGGVLIKGSSLSDRDIIDFGANLGAMRRVIVKVDAPITTHRALNGKTVSDFSITCSVRPFSEIAAGGDE